MWAEAWRSRFDGHTVLLGVTGSIAAYKACELASRLVEAGAEVYPAMTRSARQLLGPATLEALCGRRVRSELFEPESTWEIDHIAIARRIHLALIAPATANIIAKAAHGIADDWLSTTLLATWAPVVMAPAMNADMYSHPATSHNLDILRERGVYMAGPAVGRQACGTEGPGRLAEPAEILMVAARAIRHPGDLRGKHVLISAGGNREPLDPVRFVGNASSGRMGWALAFAAWTRGASVTVILGTCDIPPPPLVNVIPAATALAMRDAVLENLPKCDIFISAAAVADYRPDSPQPAKRKRSGASWTVTLVPNPDILLEACQHRRPGQILVGFAAETEDTLVRGMEKRCNKGADLLVANTVGGEHGAIGSDNADAWIIGPGDTVTPMPNAGKLTIADRLLDCCVALTHGT